MGWVMVLMPIILLLMGIPIFLVLLSTCITAIVFFSPLPHTVVHQVLFDALNKFPLIAVPFFIFTGELMSRGGLSTRLLRWVASMFGSFRASLPLTSLGFAAVFGAISGATTASVAAVGSITYPRLRQAGYSERFASALIVSECALDNLIPPSIAFILYGIATETSVAHLFAAGIIPGLVLGGVFALYIYLHSFKENIDVRQKFRWPEFINATREGIWPLGAIAIIFGGIYSGVFSPTEAAGVSCVYAIFVAMVVYREVNFAQLFECAARTLFLTATFFLIVSVAGMFGWLLTISGVAGTVSKSIIAMQASPWVVLLMINLTLLVVGCFLDTGTALLVLSPLLLPIARQIGVDPIHFGVIVVMNLTIGGFHPPFGLNIFVFQALFNTPSNVLFPGLIPFVVLAVLALMLVTYIPALSLFILPYLL
ncbi:MAG: TRAP transporter large permease [Burkholderiales bacterium]